MIVVFDSGIWVSAMEFGGTLEAVVRAIAQDRFAVCDQIEEEVVRVLTRKFGWDVERVRSDLALLAGRLGRGAENAARRRIVFVFVVPASIKRNRPYKNEQPFALKFRP